MPTATKTRPAKRTAKKATKRPAKKRTLSRAHKKALAEGRSLSATVDRYLIAVNTPKRRGRKVSNATLVARMAASQDRIRQTTGLDKLLAAKDFRDIKARLESQPSVVNIGPLEKAFIKIAKRFSDQRGVSYGAWRDAGVSAEVLRKAGIARTRDVAV